MLEIEERSKALGYLIAFSIGLVSTITFTLLVTEEEAKTIDKSKTKRKG